MAPAPQPDLTSGAGPGRAHLPRQQDDTKSPHVKDSHRQRRQFHDRDRAGLSQQASHTPYTEKDSLPWLLPLSSISGPSYPRMRKTLSLTKGERPSLPEDSDVWPGLFLRITFIRTWHQQLHVSGMNLRDPMRWLSPLLELAMLRTDSRNELEIDVHCRTVGLSQDD